MAGTLNVSTPDATEDPALVEWVYTPSGSETQQTLRVTVRRTADEELLYDSGTVISADDEWPTPVPDEIEIEVEVFITVDEGVEWPTVSDSVIYTPDYTPPPAPSSLSAVSVAGYNQVAVINTAPTPPEVAIAYNVIERRKTGVVGDPWVLAGEVGIDGVLLDFQVASGVEYDYRARAASAGGTYSTPTATDTAVSSVLHGVWLHDPLDPLATVRQFLHTSSRVETIQADVTVIKIAGRAGPVVEYGESQSTRFGLTALIPFGSQHDAAVQWWRDRVAARTSLFVRDGRGRVVPVAITAGPNIVDVRTGTEVTVTLQGIDYAETELG